jgi:hypothetical protein
MLGTALLSSLFTLGLAYLVFDRVLRERLEEHIDQQVEQAAEEIGREIEERVKRGVMEGVTEGVSALPSTEVITGATRTAARSGIDFLGAILGVGRRPPLG